MWLFGGRVQFTSRIVLALALASAMILPASQFAAAAAITINVVTDAGAVPDGATDDTAAFSTALSRFDSSGGTLIVPSGTYLVKTDSLQVPTNVSVNGTAATLKAANVGQSLLSVLGANIAVTGLTLEGANLAVRGMTVRGGSTGVTISNDVLQNFTQPSDSTNSLYNDVPAGIRIEGDGNAITIDSTTIQNVVAINTNGPAWPHKVARGVWIDPASGQSTTSKNITIQNSTFANVAPKDDGDCIVIQDSADSANLTIKNNSFDYCHKRAIKIQVPGATITGNHINNPFLNNNFFDTYPGPFTEDMYSAISVYASNVTVDSNTIGGVGSFFNGVEADNGSCTPLSGISITNNTIQMGASSNITGASSIRAVSAVDHLTVAGNQLDYAQDAITLHPSVTNTSVSNNTFGAHVTADFQYYGTPPCPPAPVAAPPAAPSQSIGVPAYMYPGTDWSRLGNAASTVSMAIMNPSSGPGPGVNFDYLNQVQQSRAQGVVVLGYVPTNYGQRSEAAVKTDIDQYYAWYDVDGIFLDQASTDCGMEAYYADLNTYVKAKGGIGRTVLNPGTATNECFMPAADTLVTFEGNYTSYLNAYSAPAWTANYPANRFWHIVYAVPTDQQMQYAVALSKTRGAGWIYATSSDVPNPYSSLPADPYWSDEVTAAQANISLLDLTALVGPSAQAHGINGSGQVVGEFLAPDGVTHGFVFTAGQVAVLGGLPGGSGSVARAINDSGEVVGQAWIGGTSHAVAWSPNGAVTDLGTFAGSGFAAAYAINNGGQIVGGANSSDNMATLAVLWNPGSPPKDLGNLGSIGGNAFGINDAGQVTGVANEADGSSHAFLWTAARGMVDLGTLGGRNSQGQAINQAGLIAGQADTSSASDPFASNGSLDGDLGNLGGTFGIAEAINTAGETVGAAAISGTTAPLPGPPPPGPSPSSTPLPYPSRHAFLYRGTSLLDMNTLLPTGSSWLLEDASGINDRGQAIGKARVAGQDRAFLLMGIASVPTSPSLTIQVPNSSNPAPVVTSLAPLSVQAATSGFTLTVTGSGFVRSSTVQWNGAPRQTTFVSSTQLTAAITAADVAAAGAAHVSVSSPAPGGGASSTLPLLITASSATVTASQTADSSSPTGTAAVSVGGSGAGTPGSESVTASGVGVVSVAAYTADPATAPTFNSSGGYIDVNVAPGSTFTQLSLLDCNLGGGTQVYWFDGSAWHPASSQTPGPGTGCVTVQVNASTSPSLSQLTGTPLAAGTPPRMVATATTADGQAYTSGTWTSQNVTVTFSCLPAAITTVSPPQTVSSEGSAQSVTGTCSDPAGDHVSSTFGGIDIDRTPPTLSSSSTPGAAPKGIPPVTIHASLVVQSKDGTPLGTIQPVTCYDAGAVSLTLNAADAASGAQSLTYATTGAQVIPPTVSSALPVTLALQAPGYTILTFSATDVVGNRSAAQTLGVLILSGTQERPPFTCVGPVPTFSIPTHGILQVSGTADVLGYTVPISRTVRF